MGAAETWKGGFTLVEILVVAAVIAVLFGLLLPVLASARGAAWQANCFSNLRQLGYAFHIYSTTYDGLIPHEDNGDTRPPFGCGWYVVLKAYTDDDGVFFCPAARRKKDFFSYKMNSLLEDGKHPFFPVDGSPAPSRTVLLFDGRIDNAGVRHAPKGTWNMVSDRHGAAAGLLFLDTHAEKVIREFDEAGWKDEGGFVWNPYAAAP